MSSLKRAGGIPLAARLIGVVAIPIIATTVLALDRIETEQRLADEADAIVAVVEVQRDVAAIYRPAQIERIGLVGLARVDELKLPRQLVVTYTGIDLEDMYDQGVVDLDEALDALAADHASMVLADGSKLGDRLTEFRMALDRQRINANDRRTTTADVEIVFNQLDDLLALTLDSTLVKMSNDNNNAGHAQLDALGDVIVSGGRHAYDTTRALVYRTEDPALDMRMTRATHESDLDRFEALLDPDQRRDTERLRALLPPPVEFDPTPEGIQVASSMDASLIKATVEQILEHIDYVEALKAYSSSFHDEVASDVAASAAMARSHETRTKQLLIGIIVITLALVTWVLWSTLAPIRRLTRRAATIGSGQLDLPPVPLSGPSDVRALTATMNGMLATLHQVDTQVAHLASGSTRLVRGSELPGAIGVSIRESVQRLSDITSQLHRSEQLSSAVVAQAADAIWTVDPLGIVLTANQASVKLTQTTVDAQVGRSIDDLITRRSGEATVKCVAGLDGQPRVLVTSSVVDIGIDETADADYTDTEPPHVTVIIAHDISERTRFEERLAHQASHDALTSLPNRFAVLQHLDHLVSEPTVDVAVLFVDIDAFKSVNDTHGHAAGDRVLEGIASRIKSSVRSGEFVGRLGGDEFVVVTQNFSNTDDVVALGHRIIREVEQPHQHGDQVFVLSASVGVAIPTPGTSSLDMIRQADNAVYQAKRRGRGRVEVFDESLQHAIEREAELELDLRRAVRNDELRLHLQPVIDLTSGDMTGAEALVRWQHPTRGMIAPGEFIPLAEKSALIFELERWVLAEACDRLAAWRTRDPETTMQMAVNISGRHLIEGDLLADVCAALERSGADATMLELELTETHLLDNLDRATSVLDALREMGITIAVDDFGTGYSSMSYLRNLPIDTLKIDRSFVARATEHGYDSTVIEAMLTIGRTLDLRVVAEGIETEEQLEFLKARGCDRAQGYKIARPMPIIDAEALIFADQSAPAV